MADQAVQPTRRAHHPAVLSQLQTTANVEPNWTYVDCQGAAGSSYCQFINADGDSVTVRLDNQLLGRSRATTEVKLDQTTYSNNAVEYVKAFIEAWRNANTKRMAALANQAEVDYFTHYTPPGAYSTCATLAGGIASVRVYNAGRPELHAHRGGGDAGAKHAITGHAPRRPPAPSGERAWTPSVERVDTEVVAWLCSRRR